jgi:glycerol-3-phosphate dehydrogenase
MEHEMIAAPVDFYFRRTGDLLFDVDSVRRWKAAVCSYMAHKFNWSKADKAKYTAELDAELEAAASAGTRPRNAGKDLHTSKLG